MNRYTVMLAGAGCAGEMTALANRLIAGGRRVYACRLQALGRPDWVQTQAGALTTVTIGAEVASVLKDWNEPVDHLFVRDETDPLIALTDEATTVHFADGRRAPGRARKRRAKAYRAPERVAVLGGGLAGALVSYYLMRHGIAVDLYEEGPTPASGASALYAGIFHPHWQASDNPLFRLTRAGFDEMLALSDAFPVRFDQCGVVDVAPDDETWEAWRAAVAEDRPFRMTASYAELLEKEAASARCGLTLKRGAWFYPSAGVVSVSGLVRDLIEASQARVILFNHVSVKREGGAWRVNALKELGDYETVVVACGVNSPEVAGLPRELLQMDVLYGRISLPVDRGFGPMKCAVTGSGYITRRTGFLGLGATYERGGPCLTPEAAHAYNRDNFSRIAKLPDGFLPAGFYEGARAVSGDRLPVAGRSPFAQDYVGLSFKGVPEEKKLPVAPGLWLCTAFGSRGLSWGAWAAKLTAARIAGAPALVPASLEKAVSPLRFAARSFRQTKGGALF